MVSLFLIVLVVVGLVVVGAGVVGLVLLLVWQLKRRTNAPQPVPPVHPPVTTPPLPRACPKCGASLPANAPEGLCPRCVLGVGLATHTEATGEAGPYGTKILQPPPAPGEIGQYFPQLEILECLGRGGMGVVYKARQGKLNRLVALKVLAPEKGADPKFAERFLREAQALARLSHPNIVTVHDFGEAEGHYYLLMEYVDGVTLRQLLQSRKITPEEALNIVPSICDALQFAHKLGIVHRDIKPENVLLDKEGRVKIADFGIAKLVGAEAPPLGLTEERSVIGTPHYMAPEQVEKPQLVDHRADIYSLGVVFYEMLTGELPLGKFQPPSRKVQVDVRLDEVVLHALEKEPERRYQQASDVKTAVEAITASPGAPPADSAGAPPVGAAVAKPFARLSRAALWGAVWAPWFFVGAVAMLFVVLPVRVPGGSPHLISVWPIVLGLPLLLLAVTAPFGTTILGWIAIAQIRHSAGRLYGLGLALFDGLLFPLLLLGLFITWVGIGFRLGAGEGIIIGVVVDALVAWRIMRHVTRSVASGPDRPGPGKRSWKWAKRTAIGLGATAVLLVLIRLFALQTWTAATDDAAPQAPKGSRVLVWRLARSFSPGDLVAFLPESHGTHRACLGRVISRDRVGNLTVSRHGQSDFDVARSVIVGRVLTVYWRAETAADLANQPQKLRTLPTAQVIDVGLGQLNEPWAWQELERRAGDGRLSAAEGGTILDGLVEWMRRKYPDGYREPLHWLPQLLNELAKRKLVTETQEVRFLEVFHGKPTLELPRLREGQQSLSLNCTLRNIWHQDLLGLVMLNEVRSVTVDGEPVPLPAGYKPAWRSYAFYRTVELPDLAPGKHSLKLEVESALVAVSDLTGLPEDAPSTDWPPAKRRWTRSAEASLEVFAKDAKIVGLTRDPALDPVVTGALSARPIIIHPKGQGATAVVLLDVNDKLRVPVSFDVTLRLAGESLACGGLWHYKSSKGSTHSGGELSADLSAPDPQTREADLILTPNPGLIEAVPGVESVWGKEIVFNHVPLTRQDLAKAAEPAPEFVAQHRAELGQKALDAARDFVEEHQWKMQRESGDQQHVVFKATDGAGKGITFEEAIQADGMSRFTIKTEPGVELSAQRIGAAIWRRLGWVPPGPVATEEPASRVEFGPVIERQLSTGLLGVENRVLDLDAGRLLSVPTNLVALNNPRPLLNWMLEQGADLMVTEGGIPPALNFHLDDGLLLRVLDSSRFESMAPTEVRRRLGRGGATQATTVVKTDVGALPVFVFRTGEGGEGVLQVLGVDDPPGSVRIRYKLVLQGMGKPAAASGGAGESKAP